MLFKSYQNFPVQDQAQVNQYAADYIDLKPTGDLSIDFKGQTTVPLVNAKPAGKYAWWSNRGDDDDSTLTRTVDLTKVPTATLTFSTWYNIENGYDYVYVEASTDNGRHWQILPGQHTNSNDKSGNAYGPGWTGVSGGGDTPQWIDERVDLTPFAGKEVQLRFEYVTDDAVNGPGFLLDNIAIPEIGFYDGGENGTNGWQASGWVLTDNTLDERWLVQVVESGQNTVHVDRMKVGPDGHGTISVPGAANYDSVKLIVSGLAPVTTEPASFSYTITQQTNAAPAVPTVSPLPGQPSPVPTTTVAQPSASQPAADASQSPAAPAVTSDVPLGALATQPASLSAGSAIPTYTYQVVHEYPHDPTAWTEGLVYQNGYLYESTGIEGQSSLRKVNLDTGQVVQRYDMPNQYYGEGIALYGDKIAQLTWKNQAGFVYDQASFKPVGQFTYSGEGWGLTYDGQYLIMSDGTDVLRFLDPETFQEKNRISVSANGTPVTQLNELEYINGEIYANIWQTDRIARINPNTGQVTGWVDLAGLLSPADRQRDVDVLNGIAYDAEGQRLFVTGKLWPKLFEIHLLLQS